MAQGDAAAQALQTASPPCFLFPEMGTLSETKLQMILPGVGGSLILFILTFGVPLTVMSNRGEFKRVEKDSNLQQLCMLSTLQCVSVYHVV